MHHQRNIPFSTTDNYIDYKAVTRPLRKPVSILLIVLGHELNLKRSTTECLFYIIDGERYTFNTSTYMCTCFFENAKWLKINLKFNGQRLHFDCLVMCRLYLLYPADWLWGWNFFFLLVQSVFFPGAQISSRKF